MIVEGQLIEDRTPASPPPATDVVFARVPRQLPWFDIVLIGTLGSVLAEFLWHRYHIPGWILLAAVAGVVTVLGAIRRYRRDQYDRLRQRIEPLLALVGRHVPEIRRIVLQTSTGRLVGVELAHPSHWPPTSPRWDEAPIQLRAEGHWFQEGVLLRAETITVIGNQGDDLAHPIRARAFQTLPVALGSITLLLLAVAAVEILGQ